MLQGVLLGGRYKLAEAIGAGGSGTVFRARDQRTGTDVAVKVVAPGFEAERLGARLRREASVLRRIASRHVARILDSGEDVPGTWLAMELVVGVPLSPEALGRPLLPHEVLRVARGLLEGLAATHEAGVIHGDVKPLNVLVPRGEGETPSLEAVTLVDFGVAALREEDPRGARFALEASAESLPPGTVLGTARYLAPEVLAGRPVDPRADVYATGLVLFELLGAGQLFPGATLHEQLRARLASDPVLEDRVPSPLASVLGRMLARDPLARFPDAAAVLSLILDLDTAPVSIGRPQASSPLPPPVLFSLSAPRLPAIATGSPPSTRAPVGVGASLRPAASGARLASLPESGEAALAAILQSLDLAMLDALARRERGAIVGRVARAVSLGLRLELDAAALLLEPLVAKEPLARLAAATVVAPRARGATRARLGVDRPSEESSGAPLDPDVASAFTALGAAIASTVDAPRDVERVSRALELLEPPASSSWPPEVRRRRDAMRATLRLALLAARARTGELDVGLALQTAEPLVAARAGDVPSPLERVLRAMFVATLASAVDAPRARLELERASRSSTEAGAVLLEVVSGVAWGVSLVQGSANTEQGLALLERTGTLLAHGDVPTLEHAAHHHRAAALLARGEWAAAVAPLQAAREAARAERARDGEVLSTAMEVLVHLAAGRRAEALEAEASLGESANATRPRPAAFAWAARAALALHEGDAGATHAALESGGAAARRAPEESVDAAVVIEALRALAAADRGDQADVLARAERLQAIATGAGFTEFHWNEVLRAILSHVEPPARRGAMTDALDRIVKVLGRSGVLARERPTSAPPPVS